ncbi:MAG: hypothetical protein JJU11_00335 [Candidatus Sumerlaeia bacterium]|nr:hypothetical protein [Candidatus Sumerlaeia bacterium]
MGRNRWDEFKPIRHEEKRGGVFTYVAIVAFSAIVGAGLGLAVGFWLAAEAAQEVSVVDDAASVLNLIVIIPGILGALFMAGAAGRFLWDFEKNQREDAARRSMANEPGGTGGPFV